MLSMKRNALAYGINTELKMTMDFAELALKMKKLKRWDLIKIQTIKSYLTVMEHVNKKI